MIAGVIATFVYISNGETFDIVPTLIFGAGALVFITGLYRTVVLSIRDKGDQSTEIRARTVSDILQVAAMRESLIELLNYSLDRFLEIVSLNSGAIHIYHKNRETLIMGAYRGLRPAHAKKLEQLIPGQTAIGKAIQNKRVLIIRDLSVSPDYRFFGGRIEDYSFLAVAPIMVDNDCWGVITLLGRKKYQRGMMDINLLEQLGDKLGQALLLGKKNRAMMIAISRLENKIGLYNSLFVNIGKNRQLTDNAVFQTLSDYPVKLFGDRSFCILKVVSDRCRLAYYRGLNVFSSDIDDYYKREIDAESLEDDNQTDNYFSVDLKTISNLIPDGLFKNNKLIGYKYFIDDEFSGIIVVDETEFADVQRYKDDLQLIGNLFSLSYLNTIYQKEKHESESIGISEEKITGISDELSSILSGIAKNVQIMSDHISQNGDAVEAENYIQWLDSVKQAAFQGIDLIDNAKTHNIRLEFVKRFSQPQEVTDSDDAENKSEAKFTALVIENKEIISGLLTDLFSQIGYNTITIPTGKEGLDYLKTALNRQDLIDMAVIDMALEDISGLELSRRIKELDNRIHTVVISSWGVNLYKETLADARVDAVLHKPFRMEQLKQVLPKRGIINEAGNQ